jgi:Fur family zinc uptake transcriptional regulator
MTISLTPALPATSSVVERAQQVCDARGQRFTPLRRRVLEIVAAAGRPIGAYDILAELAGERGRAAPPTVYRALDFLESQGLVHKVHSLNAFVVCSGENEAHAAELFLCAACGSALEVPSTHVRAQIASDAAQLGFVTEGIVLEVRGVCRECETRRHAA